MRGKTLVKTGLVAVLLLVIVLASTPLAYSAKKQRITSTALEAIEEALSKVDYDRILDTALKISKFGSRVTGYPGYTKTIEFIKSELSKYGIKYETYTFPAIVMVDEETYLEVLSPVKMKIKAYPLWPHAMISTSPTPPEGIKGELVYAGDGELEDFDGKNVNGSIVLMEFNSLRGWIHALRFGAKAVVFIEPKQTDRYEAYSKFEHVIPISFTRVYISAEDGAKLKDLLRKYGKVEVKLVSRTKLVELNAEGVLGVIEGEEKPNEIVILVAHVDSWSVVPAFANSTEEALNIATLLEIARIFSEKKPRRTVWLLFTGGHWEGLSGVREFIDKCILSKPEFTKGEKPIVSVIGIDLSVDSPVVTLLFTGHMYIMTRNELRVKFGTIQRLISIYERKILNVTIDQGLVTEGTPEWSLIRKLGFIREDILTNWQGWCWADAQCAPYILDTEPFLITGLIAFTARTALCHKLMEGVPLSDAEYVKARYDKVKPQIAAVVGIATGIAFEERVPIPTFYATPTRLHSLLYWGFVTIVGNVTEYNITKGWYDVVPKANRIVIKVSRPSTYPFACMLTFASSNGTFVVKGVTPQTIAGWRIEAFSVDEEEKMYMPSSGFFSMGIPWITPITPVHYVMITVKKFVPVYILDLYNPRLMRRGAFQDPRGYNARDLYVTGIGINVFETERGIEPLFWCSMNYLETDVALLGVPENIDLTYTFTYSAEVRPLCVIESAKGRVLWARDYARKTFEIIKKRYDVLRAHEVRTLSAEYMTDVAKRYLEMGDEAYRNHNYSAAYSYYLASWAFSSRVYADEVMPLYDEAGRSAMLFIPFLLVAAFFIERLIFKTEGIRRIASIALVEAIFVVCFAITHPAFSVIASSIMAVVGIGLLLLLGVVMAIFYREAKDLLAEVAAMTLGRHEVVRERLSAALMALSMATENMRKRPLRSALTLVSILIFAMALVSLASISQYTAVVSAPIVTPELREVPYYGLLVKRQYGVLDQMLDYATVETIKGIVGDKGVVMPRIWYYPVSVNRLGVLGLIQTQYGNVTAKAVLGITPEEAKLVLGDALVKGEIFGKENMYVVLLSERQADRLGVDVGDEIDFLNIKLKVIGIYSTKVLKYLKDFDGLDLTPVSPEYYAILWGFETGLQSQGVSWLDWNSIIIVPAKLAEKLGGFVNSVAVKFRDDLPIEEASEVAKEVAYAVDAQVYLGKGTNVYGFYKVQSYSIFGWGALIPLLFITSLSIISALLGSVKEREREIFVYSAIGLSPMGGVLMFTLEFMVYGFLGATLGYFLGWGLSKVLIAYGILPKTFIFNYASISISLVLIAVLASTFIASIYPSSKVAKIITPSLERRWKLPRKPRGNVWDIPLPFRVPSEREVNGLLEYLYEYYTGVGYEKRFYKVEKLPQVNFEEKSLKFTVRLYPFDSGTEQEVTIYFTKERREYRAGVFLKLLTGMRAVWVGASNYYFVDDLRKQLLLWGTLKGEERKKYIERAKSKLKKQ